MLGAIASASVSPGKEKATMNQKSARDEPRVLNPGMLPGPAEGVLTEKLLSSEISILSHAFRLFIKS